jgi:Tfp pilus assembly protein PilF
MLPPESEAMQPFFVRAPYVVVMFFVVAGCGGSQRDGGQFQHDEAAKLFLEAMKVRPTDQAQALELLTESIDARPSYNAYFHRAWIHALQGNDEQAQADLRAGLELEPENRDLKWLEGELKKPAGQRKLDMPPPPVK